MKPFELFTGSVEPEKGVVDRLIRCGVAFGRKATIQRVNETINVICHGERRRIEEGKWKLTIDRLMEMFVGEMGNHGGKQTANG